MRSLQWATPGGDQGDASTSREHERLPTNYEELGERDPAEGASPADTLILTSSLQNSETIHPYGPTHPICVTLFWQP